LLIQAKELKSYAKREWDNQELQINANIEAQTKIRNILLKIESILENRNERGKSTEEVKKVKSEIEKIQQDTLNRLISPKEEMI